jgi:riboflavin transporter FmnP
LTRLILVLFLKPFTIGHIANLTLDLCFLLPLILFLPKIKNSARLIFAIFMSALIFIASGAFLNLRVFCPLYGINKSAALKLIWHFMTPLNAVKSAAYGVFSFFVLKNNKHNI